MTKPFCDVCGVECKASNRVDTTTFEHGALTVAFYIMRRDKEIGTLAADVCRNCAVHLLEDLTRKVREQREKEATP